MTNVINFFREYSRKENEKKTAEEASNESNVPFLTYRLNECVGKIYNILRVSKAPLPIRGVLECCFWISRISVVALGVVETVARCVVALFRIGIVLLFKSNRLPKVKASTAVGVALTLIATGQALFNCSFTECIQIKKQEQQKKK